MGGWSIAEHENAKQLRSGYDAFARMDLEAMNAFIPEDAVWHVTGHSSLSGDYNGPCATKLGGLIG